MKIHIDIDIAKALSMLFVVIGLTHWAYGWHVANLAIDNFIVGMKMPMFCL